MNSILTTTNQLSPFKVVRIHVTNKSGVVHSESTIPNFHFSSPCGESNRPNVDIPKKNMGGLTVNSTSMAVEDFTILSGYFHLEIV